MLRFLVTCAAVSAPSLAAAADVTLYELTENVTLTRKSRSAISQLADTARKGTPICPEKLLIPGRFECVVNVAGDDDVDRTTGHGPVDGKFTVDFKGDMDFGPSLTRNLPYGTVMVLPHAVPGQRAARRLRWPHAAPGALSPGPRPNPKPGDDVAWIEVVNGQPTGWRIDDAPEQMNLGRPVVRFEITFR